MTPTEIQEILNLHRLWLHNDPAGKYADLSRANLSGAIFAFAAVSFLGHGECGRTLTAIRRKEGDAPELFCGCFTGNTKALREYIENGPEKYRTTRTLALDTVLMLLDARNEEPAKMEAK